jgi:hypothetical protein
MSETNGWPGKPGVPLNPERDGWHWCERDGGLEPRFWSSGQQLWAGSRNSWISPKMLLALFGYAGPCLTPAEVDARVKQARRDALEEAARWHDEQEKFWMEKGREVSALDSQSGLNLLAKAAEHRKHAAAIRALKGKGDD